MCMCTDLQLELKGETPTDLCVNMASLLSSGPLPLSRSNLVQGYSRKICCRYGTTHGYRQFQNKGRNYSVSQNLKPGDMHNFYDYILLPSLEDKPEPARITTSQPSEYEEWREKKCPPPPSVMAWQMEQFVFKGDKIAVWFASIVHSNCDTVVFVLYGRKGTWQNFACCPGEFRTTTVTGHIPSWLWEIPLGEIKYDPLS